MAKYREVEVVISARDEYSKTFKDADRSIGSLESSMKGKASGLSSEYEKIIAGQSTVVESSKKMGAALTGALNGSGENSGEGGIPVIEAMRLENEEKLLVMQDYNATHLELLRERLSMETEMERESSDTRMQNAAKERDFKMQAASGYVGAAKGFMGNLLKATSAHGKSSFKLMKGFGTAQAIVDTYMGVNRALGSAPPPLNFALAASVMASGMASVSKIKSVSPSGGSAGGGGLSGGRGAMTKGLDVPVKGEVEAVKQTQKVTINVHNPLSEQNWDAISEDIVGAINKAGERNVALTIKNTED